MEFDILHVCSVISSTQLHIYISYVISGNAMGYIRMIRSGGLHCCSNAIRYVHVCVCVCVCACVCVCVRACARAHIIIIMCIHVYVNGCSHVYVCVHTCTCVCTNNTLCAGLYQIWMTL